MVATWLADLLLWLRYVLLASDTYMTPSVTGLELAYTLCYLNMFGTGTWLHIQAWLDRSYARSKAASTRRYASLTQSTANHLILITGLIMVAGLVGMSIGGISMAAMNNNALTEDQRLLGAATRMVFVVQALAATGVNLTLLHWRARATNRARATR